MRPRTLLLGVAVVLVGGLIAAGCGVGDGDDGGNTPAEQLETGAGDGTSIPISPEEIQDAIEQGQGSARAAIEVCLERAEELADGNLKDLALRECEAAKQALAGSTAGG